MAKENIMGNMEWVEERKPVKLTRVRKRARIDYYHRPEEGRISQVLPILCSPRHKGSIFSSPFI